MNISNPKFCWLCFLRCIIKANYAKRRDNKFLILQFGKTTISSTLAHQFWNICSSKKYKGYFIFVSPWVYKRCCNLLLTTWRCCRYSGALRTSIWHCARNFRGWCFGFGHCSDRGRLNQVYLWIGCWSRNKWWHGFGRVNCRYWWMPTNNNSWRTTQSDPLIVIELHTSILWLFKSFLHTRFPHT